MKLSPGLKCAGAFFLVMAFGCSDRTRISDNELIGKYVTNTNIGKEELTLQSDKTYVQTFSSPKRQFTNRGRWQSNNRFSGRTEVELDNANLSEDDPSDSSTKHGNLYLQVHRENGTLRLARNESADWYYDRAR